MHQHECLEAIEIGDSVHDQVVVPEDRTHQLVLAEGAVRIVETGAGDGDHLGVRLARELDPRLGAAPVDLRIGYRAAECDHLLPLPSRT